MKRWFTSSLLITAFPLFIHAARYGLLRIAESKGATMEQSPAAGFRSLFEEDLNLKFRDLVRTEGHLFSLSMSFPTIEATPSPVLVAPTSAPVLLAPTSAPTNAPASSPISLNTTTVTVAETGEKNETGSSTTLSTASTEKVSPTNIALIVLGSCALVGLAAVAAKRFQGAKGSAKGGSSESLSVGTTSYIGLSNNNSMDSDMQNIQM